MFFCKNLRIYEYANHTYQCQLIWVFEKFFSNNGWIIIHANRNGTLLCETATATVAAIAAIAAIAANITRTEVTTQTAAAATIRHTNCTKVKASQRCENDNVKS